MTLKSIFAYLSIAKRTALHAGSVERWSCWDGLSCTLRLGRRRFDWGILLGCWSGRGIVNSV
jgi:hypothetical protein